MNNQKILSKKARWQSKYQFISGFILAASALLTIGEVGVRIVTPRAVQPYLKDDLTSGPFRSDSVYGVQYKSWEIFRADYADAFKSHDVLFSSASPPKSWAMFGSSFVHAPGMLADTARKLIPNRHVFNLGRNELSYVRAAQIEMLLEHDLRPERIVFALMPLDISVFAKQSFAMVHANSGGGIAFEPRLPVICSQVVRTSRLALTSWVRAEMQYNIPFFKPKEMTRQMDPRILDEVDHLFARIEKVSQRYQVPVTILLIPNYEQITKGAGFVFQDELLQIAKLHNMDLLDVREAFCNYPDKPALFIPDKHFSDLGNRTLLRELLNHLHSLGEAQDVSMPDGFSG